MLRNIAAEQASVDLMTGLGERASGLADLAYQQVRKDPAGARVTVDLAWQEYLKEDASVPDYNRRNAAKMISSTRALPDDVSGAKAVIQAAGAGAETWPLQNIVQKMVEDGETDEALSLARSQTDGRLRANCLLAAANAMLYRIEDKHTAH